MVSAMFEHLPAAKQARVHEALLKEFSTYPLAQAQVARIVATAEISRGSFYKYFTDLTDAYQYLFDKAMVSIHAHLPESTVGGPFDPAEGLAATRAFLRGAQNSTYRELIRLHFGYNESTLQPQITPVAKTPQGWAAMVLCHTTIRDGLLEPATIEPRLQQLHAALTALKEG